MKKTIYILMLSVLLSGCAAEKRLQRLLIKHPELQYVDTLIIKDTITRPEEQASTTLTLSDLVAMDSIATAALCSTTSIDSLPSKDVTTASSRAGAALSAKGDGKFVLTATAPPDTIVRNDTITQLHYITEYKDREVIVYRQRPWQAALMYIGILAILAWIAKLIAEILTKALK